MPALQTDQYFKVDVPKEQQEKQLQPGDVSLRTIERVSGVFQVTFAWCDMLGNTHTHTFARGDLFSNFDSVLKVFTDGGLPFDLSKKDEFQQKMCQLSTFAVRNEKAPEPAAATKN